MHSRRALLYVPGDDRHKIEKAAALGVDCIILDVEDGVALNRKEAARSTIAAALVEVNFGPIERLVRINPVASGMAETDLQAVLPGRPDGIVLPKVEAVGDICWLADRLAVAELRSGWPAGSIGMIAVAESARAMLNLAEICAASDRLSGLIFGAEDLAADLGATRTRSGLELLYARSQVVLYAAAFGLAAYDMVCTDLQDLELVRSEAQQAAEMGYAGKQIIHPRQVQPVQQAFTPSPAALAEAARLVAAFDEHQARGAGAFALDGKMVDMPVVRRAMNLLARADKRIEP